MFVSSSVRIAFIIYRGEYKCILFMGDIDPCMHIDQSSFREDFLTVEDRFVPGLVTYAVLLPGFPFLERFASPILQKSSYGKSLKRVKHKC